MYFYITPKSRYTTATCAPHKNSCALHFSISPFPCFLPCRVSHLFFHPHLVTTPLNSGLLCPLHKLFVPLKPPHATNAAFRLLGHRRQSVLALPWLVCVRGAKQNPDKVLHKALTALQAVLQEDDSAGGFF